VRLKCGVVLLVGLVSTALSGCGSSRAVFLPLGGTIAMAGDGPVLPPSRNLALFTD
jgi:hypothetical protein